MNKLFIIIFLISCISLPAKCDNLTALVQNYTQLQETNITCESLVTSELTPFCIDYYKKQNIKVNPKWQTRVFFCANKVGFELEVTRLDSTRKFDCFAFNGTSYATYHGALHNLTVSKTNAAVSLELWNFNSVLFLPGMFKPNASGRIDLLWRDAISPDFWRDVPRAFSAGEGGVLNGTVYGNKLTLTIDQKSPLGISAIESYQDSSSNKALMKYSWTEIGEVPFMDNGIKKSFFYPRKAMLQRFEDTGDLLKTDTHEITKISINDPKFDDSKFTVDPSIAQRIYDMDTKVWIQVPK